MKRIQDFFQENFTSFKAYFIILLIYIFFHSVFEAAISKYLVIPITSQFEQGIFSLLSCVAILVISIVISISKSNKRKLLFNSILTPLFVLSFYCYYRFSKESPWFFYSIQEIDFLKFSDILMISFLLFLIQWNPKEQISKDSVFLEDCFDTFGKVDELKRNNLVDRIAKSIKGTTLKKSFAIGISGKWGSGKSVMLELLKTNLKDEIVIEYSPWKREKKIDIIKDFFERLEENAEIRKYPSLSSSLIEYGQTVLQNSSNYNIQSLYKVICKFFNIKKQNEEEKLRNALIEKKLVILIDDLDRLDKEEILEILKLVRNTFSFPNTFFVVTYDREHILKLLSKESESYSGYLDKIFQFEVPIPIYPDDLIHTKVIELLRKGRTDQELMEISAPLDHLSTFFIGENKKMVSYYLGNLRDAIRFVNSFNFNFSENTKEDVAIEDFIILELLKTKYQFIYNLLKNDYLLKIDQGKFKYVKIEDSKYFPYELEKEEIEAINRTLDRLYTPYYRLPNSIVYSINKLAYFSSDLFDNIPYRQIKKLRLENDIAIVKSTVLNWKNQNKSYPIFLILHRIDNYNNFLDFKNVIYSLAYLFEERDPDEFIKEILLKLKNNETNSFKSEEIKDLIETFLREPSISTFLRSEICYQLLTDKIYNNDSFEFISNSNLRLLNFNILKEHYNKFGFDDYLLVLYQKNVDNIASNHNIYINPIANQFVKRILLENPDIISRFLNKIIVKLSGEEKEQYTIWGFVHQIFETIEDFDLFVKSLPDSIEKFEVLTILRKLAFKKKSETDLLLYTQHTRYTIEIPSDDELRYLGSSFNLPDPKLGNNVVYFHHLWEDGLTKLPAFEKIKYAYWIAHNYPISDSEAIKGGVYSFLRKVNFDLNSYKLIKGEIYFVVDDFLDLTINGTKICSKFQTFDKIEMLSIDRLLFRNGENEFHFVVENADGSGYKRNHPLSLGEQNPYGLKFNIILQFQKIKY